MGPSVRDFFNNFGEYDAPVVIKLGLATRNLSKRVLGKGCCGHHGQPGC